MEDDAQKRLEARKARLDEARKKRLNNLRKGGAGPSDSTSSPSPSTSTPASSSPSTGARASPGIAPTPTQGQSSLVTPFRSSPTSSPLASSSSFSSTTNGTSTPKTGGSGGLGSSASATAVRPSQFVSMKPPSQPPVAASPSSPAAIRPAAASSPSSPAPSSLGSSSSFAGVGSAAVGVKNAPATTTDLPGSPKAFTKPRPPSARTRPPASPMSSPGIGRANPSQGSPSGSPSSSPGPAGFRRPPPHPNASSVSPHSPSASRTVPVPAPAPSPASIRSGSIPTSTQNDEEKRKADEARRKAEEERKMEEERKCDQEEAKKAKEEAVRREEESMKEQTQEELARQRPLDVKQEGNQKRLHYVSMFVEMQKQARTETKARRQEAREAREHRIQQKREDSVSALGESINPIETSPDPKTSSSVASPNVESTITVPPIDQSNQQEESVEREIRMIIEIGKLKEEVDLMKQKCKEEESQIAELKRQLKAKADAAAAQRNRTWVAGGSNSGPVGLGARNKGFVSAYNQTDITKRPLVGGARFFSVYTPAGEGSPISQMLESSSPEQLSPPSSPKVEPALPAPVETTTEDSPSHGRGKLMRSKSGKILRSFISTYIPAVNSGNSSNGSGSKSPTDSASLSSDEVPTATKKAEGMKKRMTAREMRKSVSMDGVKLKRKPLKESTDESTEEKRKEKERLKQEKKERKEKDKMEKNKKKGSKNPKAISVFNSTLEEVMSLQEDSDGEVPIILKTLTDAIFSLKGNETEGIFRVSPAMMEVNRIKDQFDSQNYELTTNDPHVIAALLKLWFRELGQPVIPHEFYDDCIKRAHFPDQISELISRLPSINQKVIDYFAKFLLRLAADENVAVTKMGLDNLAIVFSPGFLRCLDPMKMLANAALEGLFVENLIELYKS